MQPVLVRIGRRILWCVDCTLGCHGAVRGVRLGNYAEANDSTGHSIVHGIFVGVTIDGGYNGPGLYARTDAPLPTGSAVEGSGTTSPVYTVLRAKDPRCHRPDRHAGRFRLTEDRTPGQ
jgi:hypothetical protein